MGGERRWFSSSMVCTIHWDQELPSLYWMLALAWWVSMSLVVRKRQRRKWSALLLHSKSSHLPLSLSLSTREGRGPCLRSLLQYSSALTKLGSLHQRLFSWVTSYLQNNTGDRVGTEGLVGQTACWRQLFPMAVPAGAAGATGAIFIGAVWDAAAPGRVQKEHWLTQFCTKSHFFFPVDLRIFFRLDRSGEMKREKTD